MIRARVLALPLLLSVAACGEYLLEPDYLPPPPGGPYTDLPPPAPLYEEVPPPPFDGAVWVDGYWSFSGARYLWVRGRWMRPPQVGLIWYRGGWVRHGAGFLYVRGRWAAPGLRWRYRWVHPRYYYRPGPYYSPYGGRYRRYYHYHGGPPWGPGYGHPRGPHPGGHPGHPGKPRPGYPYGQPPPPTTGRERAPAAPSPAPSTPQTPPRVRAPAAP
jgi:hypothetical protein